MEKITRVKINYSLEAHFYLSISHYETVKGIKTKCSMKLGNIDIEDIILMNEDKILNDI